MEQKEPLRIKCYTCCLLFALVMMIGCANNNKQTEEVLNIEKVDVAAIPPDTVLLHQGVLQLDNGIWMKNEVPFSGYIHELYDNGVTKMITSVYKGKQHGLTKSYYSNGQQRDERMYKENLAYGRHMGYWENGFMKFDFTYYNDKREGIQKQWYYNGQPYTVLTFKNDREEGLQQAWRDNGKAYINYEVKEGRRYGLQKSALCYTLVDEKLKSQK